MRPFIPGLLALAGCPYIFSPPELSRRGTDSAVDSGLVTPIPTDDPTTSSSPPSGSSPDAPTLTEVRASPRYESVELVFRVDDPNGDLSGATLQVDQGDAVLQYVVPADLDLWSQFGESILTVPRPTPCDGYADAWDISITDAAGHESPPVAVAAAVRSGGTVPAGDTDIGRLTPPYTACGVIEQLKPKQEDRLFFTLDAPTQLTADLHWTDPSTDLDLYVFDGAVELAQSRGDNPAPETLVVDLPAGGPYRLEIRYWSGPATTWQLFLRE